MTDQTNNNGQQQSGDQTQQGQQQQNQQTQQGSALTNGQQQGQQQNGADENAWAPERLRVNGADGKLDTVATAKKLGEAYGQLNTRMKDVGLPPESPDKYEIKVDDTVKPVVDEVLASDTGKQFVKDAHAAGLTNKQINFVLNTFGKEIGEIAAGTIGVKADECDAALRTVWKSDKEFAAAKGRAFQAGTFIAKQLGVQLQDIEKEGLGNSPLFIRMLEYVGQQMGEDLPPLVEADPAAAAQDFETKTNDLRNQLAALDLHDPKRKGLQQQLDALYQRKYPQTRPILQGRA